MSPKEKQATPKVAFVFLGPLTNESPAQAGSGAQMRGIRKCTLTARGKIILCTNTVTKPPEENTGKCPCILSIIP